MEPTRLEKAVLESIAATMPALRTALANVEVVERSFTGAGLYTDFVEESVPWDRPPIDGPQVESPVLEHGAGSLLWLSGGVPVCLEMFAYVGDFPEQIDEFEISR